MKKATKDSTKRTILKNQKKYRKKSLKALKKGKIKRLGFIEGITVRFAGWSDGRKNLFQCNDDIWQSTFMKNERDAYEEFCAKQFGNLKIEEEDAYSEFQYLMEQVYVLMAKLYEAKNDLRIASDMPENSTLRKPGEEILDDVQVAARRKRERIQKLKPLDETVNQYIKQLHWTVDTIFFDYSHLSERFDTAKKITNRVCEHSRQRVDVYWRSAMRKLPELPTEPTITYSNQTEHELLGYLSQMDERLTKLRSVMEASAFKGGQFNNEDEEE